MPDINIVEDALAIADGLQEGDILSAEEVDAIRFLCEIANEIAQV